MTATKKRKPTKKLDKKRTTGFGAAEVFLVFLVLLLISFGGYYFYATQKAMQEPEAEKPTELVSSNTVTISEWGIRVAFEDADKITYRIPNTDTSVAYFSLDSTIDTTPACRNLGLGIVRTYDKPEGNHVVKLNSYYYSITGSPVSCEANTEEVGDLRNRVMSKQLRAGQFSVVSVQESAEQAVTQ